MANIQDIKESKAIKLKLADGKEYELRFTLNAMAELEERYGNVDVAFSQMEKGSFKAIRCVLWAGLLHQNSELTERQVGDLIDLSSMNEMIAALNGAAEQDLPMEGEASPN